MTRVIDTTREPIATIALVHGFAENTSSSFLEMAFHDALNGFEVVMVDLKGFGHSSGSRCCSWTVYDWLEQIETVLQQRPQLEFAQDAACTLSALQIGLLLACCTLGSSFSSKRGNPESAKFLCS
jgi:alpha-beta hydrolase superfamily lysophospholipase